jgi:KDO2-lipid IV(A) lauroyltransferase
MGEHEGAYIPKSSKGARDMVRVMQDGGKLGILIDQKYNKGLEVPFFGRPAMTSEAFAQLAQKFECPILPIRVERIKGCHYRVTVYPPMAQVQDDVFQTVKNAHHILEDWISARPGQWLWLHRRWKA